MSLRRYRPPDTGNDWALFDPGFAVPPAALARIRPLDAASAAQLWVERICADPDCRHPQTLRAGHWLHDGEAGPDWRDDFDVATGAVAGWLAARFDAAPVLWIAMKERAYELPPQLLLAHWRALLAQDDEGAFAFDERSGAFVAFGPQGRTFAGSRPRSGEDG